MSTHKVTQKIPRKRALLIGINKLSDEKGRQQGAPLVGPHADVVHMRELLISMFLHRLFMCYLLTFHLDNYGYKTENIVTLMDNGGSTELQPTRDNIVRSFVRLPSR